MKIVNCILFASLALGATFANASQTKAACSAEPSGTLTSNRKPLDLLNGGSAPAARPENGSTSAR